MSVNLNRSKLLLVDDDKNNLDILEEILQDKYQIVSSESGEDALDQLATLRPDLILLDVMMPGMDGYEVCNRIRMDEHLKYTRILYLSAKAMTSDKVKGYEQGGDDYITKPFDHNELIHKIQSLLQLTPIEQSNQQSGELIDAVTKKTQFHVNEVSKFVGLLLRNPSITRLESSILATIIQTCEYMRSVIEKLVLLSEMKSGRQAIKTSCSLKVISEVLTEDLCEIPEVTSSDIQIKQNGPDIIQADALLLKMALKCLAELVLSNESNPYRIRFDFDLIKDVLHITMDDKETSLSDKWSDSIHDEIYSKSASGSKQNAYLNLELSKIVISAHSGILRIKTHTNDWGFKISLPI